MHLACSTTQITLPTLTVGTAFLDVTGGMNNGNDWARGPDMSKRLGRHCLAGIDENRVLMIGGKCNCPGGWDSSSNWAILYDLSQTAGYSLN